MKLLARSVLTLLVLTALAFADSPHFKRAPRLTDNGLTVSASGAIAGLGNGNVIINLSFPNATATTVCTNQGGNEAPGQNPAAPVEVSGSVLIDRVKNGNVSFSLTTTPPDNPTWDVAGCQNSNWSASIDDINFGAGILQVQQETFQGSGIYEVVITLAVNL